MNEFTNTMKAIIKKAGYKNKFVAEKMGITERQLSDILNGRKIIDYKIILLFCQATDTEPNELFGYNKSA